MRRPGALPDTSNDSEACRSLFSTMEVWLDPDRSRSAELAFGRQLAWDLTVSVHMLRLWPRPTWQRISYIYSTGQLKASNRSQRAVAFSSHLPMTAREARKSVDTDFADSRSPSGMRLGRMDRMVG